MFGYSIIKTSELEELKKPKNIYYECKSYNDVCKIIDFIFKNLKEKTKDKDSETAKQQTWLLERKEKTIYFYRYNVIRNGAEIVQWIYSEDDPKYCGEKLYIK